MHDNYESFGKACERLNISRDDLWHLFISKALSPDNFLRIGGRFFVSKSLEIDGVVEAKSKLHNFIFGDSIPHMEGYLSVDQFAIMTGLSRERIYQLIKEKLSGYVIIIGGLSFLHRDSIEAYKSAYDIK